MGTHRHGVCDLTHRTACRRLVSLTHSLSVLLTLALWLGTASTGATEACASTGSEECATSLAAAQTVAAAPPSTRSQAQTAPPSAIQAAIEAAAEPQASSATPAISQAAALSQTATSPSSQVACLRDRKQLSQTFFSQCKAAGSSCTHPAACCSGACSSDGVCVSISCTWDLSSASRLGSDCCAWLAGGSGCAQGGPVALTLDAPFGGDAACAHAFQGSQAADVGIVMGFASACNLYSASGYRLTAAGAGITIRSVTLGSRNEAAGQPFLVRFSGPGGVPTVDVNVTGMPAEVIGSYAFNVPGGGFAVPPDTPGYTLQLTGAADPAGAAYLKALSNDPCKGEGGTCPDGDSSCCASTRFCAGPAYTCAGCRAEGDPCGTDAECCPGAPYCSQGVCSPCKALGDTCSDYGQCCQHVGYCSQASYMCKQAGCLGQSDADLSGRARGCCWAAGTRASCSVAATSTLACPSPLRHLQCKGAGAACSGHTECCADPKNSYCTNNNERQRGAGRLQAQPRHQNPHPCCIHRSSMPGTIASPSRQRSATALRHAPSIHNFVSEYRLPSSCLTTSSKTNRHMYPRNHYENLDPFFKQKKLI
ncbi:hypothetical protein CHLNCDRAFT_58791 [Chlorella variabilis]|uniref:Uncharacterized protein n=1 Tax=Chlorella variabilis TaxID=554065 RepID=E1ZNB7_CHLVA|nr:hypothetical protein CHLNCDRAFT_58791 [Chlorella variabilis]EFN52656.1 hypothetical protein CHLNCDRAFT_58791 [Chlorella variabilis]|eukprot:XP_005844758.1 hypothetical protein CHLNCDRAFT_58791 [Chlorella variabilis]